MLIYNIAIAVHCRYLHLQIPIYICSHLANATAKPTATEISCGRSLFLYLLYSAIFVPSFIVTVPMSGTFALPLTEVSVKSSSIWASLPRSSRAVTVADRWLPTVESLFISTSWRGHLRLDYLEAVFAAVVKDAKRYISAIKHVADF